MEKQLARETLKAILQSLDIETLSTEQLTKFVLEETDIAKFAPDGIYQIDPRIGDRIVYNSARARRPQPALLRRTRECLQRGFRRQCRRRPHAVWL